MVESPSSLCSGPGRCMPASKGSTGHGGSTTGVAEGASYQEEGCNPPTDNVQNSS